MRRRLMLRSIINTIIGFIAGDYDQISVDSNGVFTLGTFNPSEVYTVPFSQSVNVHVGDVVTFRLNSAYGDLTNQYCDGGFYTLDINNAQPQLKMYVNKRPAVGRDYTATATTNFTATHWGMMVRNATCDYNGKMIKPEIFINNIQIA